MTGPRTQQTFHDHLTIFRTNAACDDFTLVPGHAYLLTNDYEAAMPLSIEVVPLLRERLTHG